VKTAVAIGRLAQAKVLVVHRVLLTTQIVRLTATAMIALLAPVTVTHVRHSVVVAMIAMHVQHVVTMSANRAHSETAKTVQHVQVLAVASATATVQSVLHTASQIHHASKTALQSAVGQKTVTRKAATAGFPRARAITIRETPTVQTVQHAMIHANQLSAAPATQTQTRRLSSRTRFLSV
jgi:hypothetical protein